MHFAAKVACVAVALLGIAPVSAADKPIDTKRSTITIHVGKAGIFSTAGHEHWVGAPIAKGVLSDSDRLHVEFHVDAAKMQVKPDPKVDPKTQAEIQKDMQEKVLDSATYPEITFRSTQIEKQGASDWKVEGKLTLHGVTKPLVVMVKRTGGIYHGQISILQTDFGIKPVSVAGGAVKVKDELEISFRIVAGSD